MHCITGTPVSILLDQQVGLEDDNREYVGYGTDLAGKACQCVLYSRLFPKNYHVSLV